MNNGRFNVYGSAVIIQLPFIPIMYKFFLLM